MKRLRQFYARMFRSFVVDCPRCNKHFYGWQSYGIHVKIDGKHYRYVCHKCISIFVTKSLEYKNENK